MRLLTPKESFERYLASCAESSDWCERMGKMGQKEVEDSGEIRE